jgi:hypothetical protein
MSRMPRRNPSLAGCRLLLALLTTSFYSPTAASDEEYDVIRDECLMAEQRVVTEEG